MCICTLFQYDPQKDCWERYLDNVFHFVSPRFPFFSQKYLLLFQTPHRVILWCISSIILFNEHYFLIFIFVFHLLNHVQLLVSPWTAAHQASLSFTISWRFLKLMHIESMMPYNHVMLCHHLILLPSIFPRIRDFSNESSPCIR